MLKTQVKDLYIVTVLCITTVHIHAVYSTVITNKLAISIFRILHLTPPLFTAASYDNDVNNVTSPHVYKKPRGNE